MMQIASLAILWNTSPPGSVGFGSRDESPIDTRPWATSATPTSEPPCESRNWTLWLCTYFWASFAVSGATEVEPLIVIVGARLAEVSAGAGDHSHEDHRRRQQRGASDAAPSSQAP